MCILLRRLCKVHPVPAIIGESFLGRWQCEQNYRGVDTSCGGCRWGLVSGWEGEWVMEFPVLPPEINSVLMYSGAGSSPLLARRGVGWAWLRSWGRRRCRFGQVTSGLDGGGVAGCGGGGDGGRGGAVCGVPMCGPRSPGRYRPRQRCWGVGPTSACWPAHRPATLTAVIAAHTRGVADTPARPRPSRPPQPAGPRSGTGTSTWTHWPSMSPSISATSPTTDARVGDAGDQEGVDLG